MTSKPQRESAIIYQFPAGGRAAYDADRAIARIAQEPAALRGAKVVYGSGWYHEAAVQEVEPAARR